MKRLNLFLIVILNVLLTASALTAGKIQETFEKTIDINPGAEILLRNTNGAIQVTTWDKDQVRIIAEKTVKARSQKDAQRIMKEVKIIIEASPERVDIESDYPRNQRGAKGFWDWFFGDSNAQISISYELIVPQNAQLDLKTTNGSVSIEAVSGKIKVRSTNGAIKLLDIHGKVYAKTTNGKIRVDITEFTETDDVDLKTTNGSIKLYLPEDTRADIRANTTNGNISTDFSLEISGKFTRKKLRGTINGGGGRIDLDTTNGSITINQN